MNMMMISLLNVIMGTLITLSASSWLMAWMGMELNLLSFIPFIFNKNNPLSNESTMKYFLIQAMSSSLFIMFSFVMKTESLMINFSSMIIFMALLLKMAAAPFHFWLPSISLSMNWYTLFLLMTWQKIAPLSMILISPLNFSWVIMLNLLVGSIMSMNQSSLKKLMIYSSINHIGWMLTAILFNLNSFIIYFLVYSYSLASLIIILNYCSATTVSQLMILSKNMIIILSFNLLSISGFPPFLSFFPKLFILKDIIKLNLPLTMFLILSSLLALFSYLRIVWPNIMKPSKLIKFQLNNTLFSYFFLLSFIFPFLSTFPMLLFLM